MATDTKASKAAVPIALQEIAISYYTAQTQGIHQRYSRKKVMFAFTLMPGGKGGAPWASRSVPASGLAVELTLGSLEVQALSSAVESPLDGESLSLDLSTVDRLRLEK